MADFAIDFASGDLARELPFAVSEAGGLPEAVYLSIFLEARADPDEELPDPSSQDPGGWWGDALAEIPGDRIGSRLWTFRRSKNTAATRSAIRDALVEALAWLLEDGVAESVEVEVRPHEASSDAIQIDVTITEATDGARAAFGYAWDLVRGGLL